MIDSEGTQVVSYQYDTWGRLVSTSDSTSTGIGILNQHNLYAYYLNSLVSHKDSKGLFVLAVVTAATICEALIGGVPGVADAVDQGIEMV